MKLNPNQNRSLTTLTFLVLAAQLSVGQAAPICTSAAVSVSNGWGWENNASCQVGVSPVSDQSACVDTAPVGDGWGWDGAVSCRVGVEVQQPVAYTCEDTPPVGDGWGWNGTESCRVGAAVADVQESAATDCVDTTPVGDGWGWNGTESCRVVANVQETTETTEAECVDTAPLGDGWGWDGTASCPVGGAGEHTSNSANSEGIEEIVGNNLAQAVNIPFIASAPVIDGVERGNEWAGSVYLDTFGQLTSIDNLIVRESGNYQDYTGSSHWHAMHDGEYLYLLVLHSEENSFREIWQDSQRVYQDDSVEIFLDGDNSKGESFDGVNDYHFALRYDDSLPNYIDWGNQGSLTNLDFDYATNHAYRSNGGWAIYEIAIKLSSAQISAEGAFGLEVQLNEDDDGGDRDAKWSWAERTAEHRAWFDPRAFGTARLR